MNFLQIPLLLATAVAAAGSPVAKEAGIRPGSLRPDELKEYETLDPNRRKLIEESLKLAAGDHWLTYTYGSAEPSNGGLDCSGSMYYILQQVKIDPPRTSGDLFEWVKASNKLNAVPASATSLDDPAFANLQPGDLLFWSGTTSSSAGGDSVSHVQMFLGHEKSDGLAVMVGSSDGRSYRGQRRNGYGVFDFKLPVAGSKARFLGYGPPKFPGGETVLASAKKAAPQSKTDVDQPQHAKKSTASKSTATTVKKKKSPASKSESGKGNTRKKTSG